MTLDELNLHWHLVSELNSASDRLQAMSSFLKAQNLDGMPRSSGESRKVEKISLLVEAQAEKVRQMEILVKKSEGPILAWINSIPDDHTEKIFYLRFIAGYEWADVAAIVGGKNTEESVKATCYRFLRRDRA